MAQIGISEFTFGYAFLYEQTHANWSGLTAAPVLPSLQQEQDAGWDAHLPLAGTDFYYQFKLSDYLSRSNALYIADGTYATPVLSNIAASPEWQPAASTPSAVVASETGYLLRRSGVQLYRPFQQ